MLDILGTTLSHRIKRSQTKGAKGILGLKYIVGPNNLLDRNLDRTRK